MKLSTIAILSMLLIVACARNPRPESPEQRAQQEARYLQGGEQAEVGPRTVVVSDEERYDDEAEPAAPPPSDAEDRRRVRERARAQIREARRAAAVVEPLPARVGSGVGLLR